MGKDYNLSFKEVLCYGSNGYNESQLVKDRELLWLWLIKTNADCQFETGKEHFIGLPIHPDCLPVLTFLLYNNVTRLCSQRAGVIITTALCQVYIYKCDIVSVKC